MHICHSECEDGDDISLSTSNIIYKNIIGIIRKYSKIGSFPLLYSIALSASLVFPVTGPAVSREHSPATSREAVLERRLAGPDGAIMVVAHRGCWKGSSENSIDAIEACVAADIDMVELDVRATRDGVLVLMHDDSVDRMTDGTGKVEDMDWADLRTLRLREGQGRHEDGTPTALTNRRIPTFDEALRAAKGRILINVDAKTALSADVLRQIDAVGSRNQILFKAEGPFALLIEQAPWVRSVRFQPKLRQPAIAADPQAAVAAYDALRPVGYEVDVKDRAFTALMAPLLRARCARYWVNSLAGRYYDDRQAVVSPDAIWGEMVALGVDTIQTDEPVLLKNYLNRAGARGHVCVPASVRQAGMRP